MVPGTGQADVEGRHASDLFFFTCRVNEFMDMSIQCDSALYGVRDAFRGACGPPGDGAFAAAVGRPGRARKGSTADPAVLDDAYEAGIEEATVLSGSLESSEGSLRLWWKPGSRLLLLVGLAAVGWSPLFVRSLTIASDVVEEVGGAAGRMMGAGANVSSSAARIFSALTGNALSLAETAWDGIDLANVSVNSSAGRFFFDGNEDAQEFFFFARSSGGDVFARPLALITTRPRRVRLSGSAVG